MRVLPGAAGHPDLKAQPESLSCRILCRVCGIVISEFGSILQAVVGELAAQKMVRVRRRRECEPGALGVDRGCCGAPKPHPL